MTAGTQWLERSLDDSANRRISIPEAFLATDGILQLYINIVSGLRVYPEVIKKNLNEELPFMATENILMHCVKNGGDRQLLHEAIRSHSVAAGLAVKQEGKCNDLLDRIANDPEFGLTRADIDKIISLYGSEMDRTISAKKCITEICDMAGQISIDPLVCNSDIKLLQNREKTTEIKTILDSFLHVYQWGQTFIVSDIIDIDSYFYSELEDV